MQKRWVIRENSNEQVVNSLSDELNIDPVLGKLLVQRGIDNFDDARHFFRPDARHLHDPFLMKDMEKAIERIEEAIKANEKILVYGDYDVDGTTSVAVVYSFLKKYHRYLEYYIPDRYLEGYGVSTKGIDYAADNGFSLIIALDCGIKAVDKVAYATERGI